MLLLPAVEQIQVLHYDLRMMANATVHVLLHESHVGHCESSDCVIICFKCLLTKYLINQWRRFYETQKGIIGCTTTSTTNESLKSSQASVLLVSSLLQLLLHSLDICHRRLLCSLLISQPSELERVQVDATPVL